MVTWIFTSSGFWQLRRWLFALRRRGAPEVIYFHQADDPYSHLTVQVLATLCTRHNISLVPMLVGPPPDSAAPERKKLNRYALVDADRLARAYGIKSPSSSDGIPESDLIRLAECALSAAIAADRFAEKAPAISEALWAGDLSTLKAIAAFLTQTGSVEAESAIQAGNRLRAKLGHYLGAMFYCEGEFYWGIDRLHYLERRLGAARSIIPVREPLMGPAPKFSKPPEIDFWFSIRSPYSWICFPRMLSLAHHYNAKLNLRFVLPMVMRGLPVPKIKSRYITFDNVREAQRLGLPFGPIIDPVGVGTERALAILHHVIPMDLGETFARAALEGCWAQGIDLASQSGISLVALRAGVNIQTARAALQDQSWRVVAEANRTDLFEAGLWGVPSFRVNGRPAHWGQDRLWMLEQDLLDEAKR